MNYYNRILLVMAGLKKKTNGMTKESVKWVKTVHSPKRIFE